MSVSPFCILDLTAKYAVAHWHGLKCQVQHREFQVVVVRKPSTPRATLAVRSTRKQPRAMPLPCAWILVVPSALAGSGAGCLGS